MSGQDFRKLADVQALSDLLSAKDAEIARLKETLDEIFGWKPFLHFCCEWDFLLIDQRDAEFEACRCYERGKDGRPIQPTDRPEPKLVAELKALKEKVEYWQKDSAAAWDKCEERRLENERLNALLDNCLRKRPKPKAKRGKRK